MTLSSPPTVVVFDYGSGNVHSAVRALERVGAAVSLTGNPGAALGADGLFVPGVGNFHACMRGLRDADGARVIDVRLAGGRPVLGVCVGMQVLFDGSMEPSTGPVEEGLGEWPGMVDRLPAEIVPHMGWSTVSVGADSRLFTGVEDERFYFVHSYAAQDWTLYPGARSRRCLRSSRGRPTGSTSWPRSRTARSARPSSTPKSGDAGAQLLENWVRSL